MAGRGRIYQRGTIYYIAYRWDGREYRERARSSVFADAEQLLEARLAERAAPTPSALRFDDLAAWYLDDYVVRRLRTLDTARGRVANLRATFGGWSAIAITTEAIRRYQRTRRAAGAAAATVNRETSALSRMLQLAVRGGRLAQRPVFPERLEERGPRQGFFEHSEYEAVRWHLPPPYQDVLDFAYYSGWRKREIFELEWSEVDAAGGVVRLSPARSKTRVGRVLPSRSRLRRCSRAAGPNAARAILSCFAAMRSRCAPGAPRGPRRADTPGCRGGYSTTVGAPRPATWSGPASRSASPCS